MPDIKIYYSASYSGFYHNEKNDYLPEDAIEITINEYNLLLDGQSKGKIIVPDDNGKPILQDVEISERDKILNEIYNLENLVSERRRQEAICNNAESVTFIAEIRSQIENLRIKLHNIVD